MRTRTATKACAAVMALGIVVAACGDDDDSPATPEPASDATVTPDAVVASGPDAASTVAEGNVPAGTVTGAGGFRTAVRPQVIEPTGPACADLPTEGAGSLEGMAVDPAATAASNNPELSTLVAAVDAAGLVDTLNGDGPFTIFAPSNAAFEKIPANVLDSILAQDDVLSSILTYHVISGQALSGADLAAAGTEVTVNGAELTFTLDGDSLLINNGAATVVCAGIPVANGIVHIIDSVLQPPSDDIGNDGSSSVPNSGPVVTAVAAPGAGPTGPLCSSIPTEGDGSFEGMADDPAAIAASNNPELSTLVAAVDAAGIVDTLNGDGPFTIFAPNNDAFEAIPPSDLDAILADTDLLTSILTYHVIAGEALTGADLAAMGSSQTVNGADLTSSINADGLLAINGNGANVGCADIPVGNGIVHIIDSVLVPPAG
ncbi:hypothetical protein BH24ACT5_BH24ACT5_21470 [soil metagenome]